MPDNYPTKKMSDEQGSKSVSADWFDFSTLLCGIPLGHYIALDASDNYHEESVIFRYWTFPPSFLLTLP